MASMPARLTATKPSKAHKAASQSANSADKAGKIAEDSDKPPSETEMLVTQASLSSANPADKSKMAAKSPWETQVAAAPASPSANPADKAWEMAAGTSLQPSETKNEVSAVPVDYAFEEAMASVSDEDYELLPSECLSTASTTLALKDVDDYQDAEDEDAKSALDLQASFDHCNAAIKRFFNNDIQGAMEIMQPWSDSSPYHSLGRAMFLFIPAMLTFDKGQMSLAMEAIKNCIRLCNKHRRTYTLAQNLGSIVKSRNYADYTDMEAHAELCYAEALLLQAALTVASGEDYSSYVRGTFNIKTCFRSYKICWKIKEHKKWDWEQSRIHFVSGVRLGTSTFNLMISLLPPKIISVLEFVGFSGSRMYGLTQLERGSKSPGLRAIMCELTLLIYYLIVIPFIGGQGNVDAAELIFQTILVTYPNSVWFLALRARAEFLRGNLRHSINAYKHVMFAQEHYRQFRILCYWELMWVHGLNMDFEESAMYAMRLVEESAWSKTTHSYIRAAMLMQLQPCDLTASIQEDIDGAIRFAPLARTRIAGRSLPMEKFITKRCERYHRQGKRLVLPAFELLNLWNMLQILTNNKDLLAMIVTIIAKTIETMKNESKDWMGEYVDDNMALVHYLHGCALTAMELPRQALRELQVVVDLKKSIKEDTFLVPYAVCEIALCYYQMGDMQVALELLNDVKKKYSGYSLETRLQFRVKARMELVRTVIGASKFTPGLNPGIKVETCFDE